MHPMIQITEGFALPTYGLLYLLAFLAGIFTVAGLATRVGVPFRRGVDAVFMICIAGEVGARLTFVITEWSRFASGSISFKQFLVGGRVVLGGVLAGVATAVLIFRHYRIPVLAFLDALMTGTALGMAIGRLACLMGGCCYGKPTDLWWGITFTDPLARQLNGTPLGVPLHPTQILQSIDGFVLFGILFWCFRRRRYDGQVFALFLVLAGTTRFIIEFLRNDPRGAAASLATSQWIGLAMVLLGVALLLRLPRRLTDVEGRTSASPVRPPATAP